MLGSNEMMWRRIVDYVDYVDYVDGGVEKRQVKCFQAKHKSTLGQATQRM